MASDPDIEELKIVTSDLATAARELSDATRSIAEAARTQNNSSTIHIDAGGLSSGIALAGVGMCVVLFVILAIWVTWRVEDAKAQQDAWLQVIQREAKAKEK